MTDEQVKNNPWRALENYAEKLIATANGCPDNECTIAARRLLDKKGIDWRQ